MLALCSMLSCTYYAHFNAGIIGAALLATLSVLLFCTPFPACDEAVQLYRSKMADKEAREQKLQKPESKFFYKIKVRSCELSLWVCNDQNIFVPTTVTPTGTCMYFSVVLVN